MPKKNIKNHAFSEDEEKALVGILYNHISFGTTLEVFDELSKEGIKRLEILRNIFKKLLKRFSLADKLDQETYLILGLEKFIKKSSIEEWIKNEGNKHLQNRAKYFLKKHYDK